MIKLSWRTIAAHKLRFVMTSFAVVLGVGFVVGSLVVTDTLRQSFETLFGEINEGIDLEVRSESTFQDDPGGRDREPLPEALVATVVAVDGVAAAEGNATGYAQPIAPDGDPVTTTGAPLLGVSWGPTDALYPVDLAAGAKPGPGEIAIDQGTFEEYDFVLGEPVDVLLGSGRETFTLVGTMQFGETNSLGGARLTAFEPATAQVVFDRDGVFDTIDIALEPGADAGDVSAALEEALPDGVEVVTGETIAEEGSDAVGQFADIFGGVLLGFACIALFVSAFYIHNTFSIVLGQRVRELALLRAIGASARQVRASVFLEAFVVGSVSSVLGIGLGMLTAMGIRGLLNSQGFGLPADSMVLEPSTVVAAVVVGLGVTLLAALSPARRAATIPPIAALREDLAVAPGSRRTRLVVGAVMAVIGAVLLGFGLFAAEGTGPVIAGLGLGAILVFLGAANLSPLVAGPVANLLGAPVARLLRTPGRLARQNATRNPYRTASTASALMIGLALVTMALVVGTSVKESVGDTIEQAVSADFIVSEPTFNGFSPTVTEALAERPELAAVSGVRFGRFRFEGAEKDLSAVDAAAMGELVDVDVVAGGEIADLGPGSIFVHEDPAGDLGLEPGDQVTVEFSRTGEQAFTVVGIHSDSTMAGNYFISIESWEQHFTDDLDTLAFARVADGVDAASAADAIDAVVADFPQLDIEDRQEFLAAQEGQIDQILIVVNVLLGLAIIIAVLGIGNTLALSVFERTRELGLLRAVGMTRRQMRRMVRWESALVSLFGAVLGVVIGIVFGLAAAAALPDSFLTAIAVPTGTLLVLVAVAVVAGLGAAILPARRAARLDVLTAIATD